MKEDKTIRKNSKFESIEQQMEFIQSLPKTELHCHIDGSIRPETIFELVKNAGVPMNLIDIKDFKKQVQVTSKKGDLIDYLKKFELPLKIFEEPENIKRITFELIEDLSKQGIAYAELRFAPFFCKDASKAEDKVRAALEGLEESARKFQVKGGLILCAMRHEEEGKSFKLVELANHFKNKGVVAVDLAGNEKDFPPNLHQKAFRHAHELGLKITIHAGETGKYSNIVDSIINLKADRIGHGLSAIGDEAVLKCIVARKIPLELCIKSNIDTNAVKSLKEHPIYKLFRKGVKVTLNTDNITVSDVTIMDEYKRLLLLGFTMKEVGGVIKNGIEASFAPLRLKEKLIGDLEHKFKVYDEKLKQNRRKEISSQDRMKS